MIVVHGLKTCDTCRKALKWLAGHDLPHRFHDLRADGLDQTMLKRWADRVGWETLVNRRGTTWRQLPAAETAAVDCVTAIALMQTHPALVKRPVFEVDGTVIVGFDAAQQAELQRAAA